MKHLLPVLVASSCLILNFSARADDGEGNGDECQINGQETMDAVVALVATSNAPAGAVGFAKLESENEDGNETATLEIRTTGLTPGDYDLSITLQSTGTNIDLGTFTVGGNEDEDDNEEGDNQGGNQQDSFRLDMGDGSGHWIGCGWGGFTNWGSWTNWSNTNFCNGTNEPVVTKTETDLPAGVNPTDIGQIIISDTNGVPMLVGDLVNPATNTVINISATVQLAPGTAAPTAAGTAQVQSTASKGKWKHQFNLAAVGMGTSTTFKMNVNGKTSGAAKSNKTGQMSIKKLPSHVPALRTLRLLDKHGNEAAHAQF